MARSMRYPRTMPPRWDRVQKHHVRQNEFRCGGCEKLFVVDDVVCFIETQVDWFRGNDEVEEYCVACAEKRGHVPPASKAERKLQNLHRDRTILMGIMATNRKKLARQEEQLAKIEQIIARHEAAEEKSNSPSSEGER